MSEFPPPTEYFSGIIFNPVFWIGSTSATSSTSGIYLQRIGAPTSIATNTTFTGKITTTDLTVTNVIQGTALNADNVLSQNNNANATHYITYTDLSTNGYGMLQKHATLNYNPNTETFTADNIVATTSMTSVTPATADNSTKVATTAYVKNQGYTSIASILANANAWTNTNTFNSFLPTTTLTTISSTTQFAPVVALDGRYGRLASGNAWTNTNTFNSNLPTTTITTIANTTQIAPVIALDGRYGRLSVANAWTNTNTFNSFLPTSTLTPTTSTQLVTKAYADTKASNSSANVVLVGTNNNIYGGSSPWGASLTTGHDLISIGAGAFSFATGASDSVGIGTNALQNATDGVENFGLGNSALSHLTTGSYNTAVSVLSMSYTNGDGSVGIGRYAMINNTNSQFDVMIGFFAGVSTNLSSYNTGIGAYTAGSLVGGTNCTFVGASSGSGIINATSTTCIGSGSGASADYSYSTAIGYNAQITSNNQIKIGTSSETTAIAGNLTFAGTINSISSTVFGYISGLTSSAQTQINNIINGTTALIINNQNIRESSPTLVTGTTLNLSTGVLYDVYSFSVTATCTVTLPTITAANLGQRITFRRVAGTTTITVISSATNVYPTTSLTAQTTILASGGYSTTIFSAVLSATPTYGWFIE